MIRTFFLLSLVVFLFSCDSTFVKYSQDYSFSRSSGSIRCAMILPERMSINYTGDVKEEFGPGKTEALIDSFFRDEIDKQIKIQSIFDTVFNSTITSNYDNEMLNFENKGESFNFKVPKAGQTIECKEGKPEMIVFIDALFIKSNLDVSGYFGSMNYGPSFSSKKDLIIEGKYILWDNMSGKLVSYGYINSVDENSFAVTKEDWINAMSDFVRKMIDPTQFKKSI